MKCDKTLMKAARELFDYVQETGHFVFAGADYDGVSPKLLQELDSLQIDALSSAVGVWEARKCQGETIDASAFSSIVRDEAGDMGPELHDKHDKPGKKHGRKNHDEGFETRVRFR